MTSDMFSLLKEFMNSPEKLVHFEQLLKKAMSAMKEATDAMQNAPSEVKAKHEQEWAVIQTLMKEKMESVSQALGFSLEEIENNMDSSGNLNLQDSIEEKRSDKKAKEAKTSGGRRKKWITA